MIDFLKYRFVCALFTALLVLIAGGIYVYRVQTRGYGFSYSVDFTGGTQVLFKFDNPVSTIVIRDALEAEGWHGVIAREFGPQEVLVRVKDVANDALGSGQRMKEALESALPANTISLLQTEIVGAGIGAALRWNSILAIIIAIIALLFYIAIRFWSFGFAAGAVIALAHDAFIMLATFLIFDREISITVIGAILAVLGYSINDTIVIFARIRDNLKKRKVHETLTHVVNVSINQTLRRTLLTSISTLLTVLAMFVLGGEALHDFSLALLIGIVFGTYSSIYIASPVMMLLHKDRKH